MTKKEPYFQKVGRIAPFGMHISQSWNELGAIESIIDDFDIRLFIELGVDKGGLAAYLSIRAGLSLDFTYVGVENNFREIDPRAVAVFNESPAANVFWADALGNSCIDIIGIYLERSARALVYCDNGDKPAEFGAYSALLKKQDLIMVHDYPKEFNEEHFKLWSGDVSTPRRIEREYLEQTHMVLFENS